MCVASHCGLSLTENDSKRVKSRLPASLFSLEGIAAEKKKNQYTKNMFVLIPVY